MLYFNLKEAVSFGDLLTMVGFFIAIWQFVKQMKISRNSSNTAQKQQWFLNVIIIPNIGPVNQFYVDLISKIKDYDIIDPAISDEERMLIIANRKNEIIYYINMYFDHLIALVKAYNISYICDLKNNVLDLEDSCTTIIDNNSTETISRRIILDNKQKFISLLYLFFNKEE